MPKETILKSGVPVNGTTERMHISWSRDLPTVQIGIEFPDAPFKFVSNTGAADIEFRSLWTEMNREDINRAIRVLRKARDQSFGKDE